MIKKIRTLILIAGTLAGLSAIPVQAQGVWGGCSGAGSSAVCADQTEATTMIERVVSTLLFILGAVAVVMIIWSGYKYIISRGDPANIKAAKDSLLYSVIGLVVAGLSYTIATIVFNAATGTTS